MKKALITPAQRAELAAMSPTRRIIVVLYHHEGLPIDEIRDIVGPDVDISWHIDDSIRRGYSTREDIQR